MLRRDETARSGLAAMDLERRAERRVRRRHRRRAASSARSPSTRSTASFTSPPRRSCPTANASPRSTFQTNIAGTWELLEACRAHGVERVIVASSDKAYGPHTELPYREDHALQPVFPYDVSKAATDLISRSYWHTWGLPVAVTRFANLYGGGDFNRSRLVPEAVGAALAGRSPVVRSDGSPERDFLYVEDAVAAYLAIWAALGRAARAAARRSTPAGAAPPGARCRARPSAGWPAPASTPDVRGAGTPAGEIDRQWVDAGKLRALTGWEPQVDARGGPRADDRVVPAPRHRLSRLFGCSSPAPARIPACRGIDHSVVTPGSRPGCSSRCSCSGSSTPCSSGCCSPPARRGHVAIIAGALFLVQFFTSDKIALASMGAREVSPAEAPLLHGAIERLCIQANLPKPRVAIAETPMPNAFAVGRSPKTATVCATTGILDLLSPSELDGVLAHELTHVQNRDVMVMTIASFFASVASFIVQMGFWFGGMFGGDDNEDGPGAIVVILVSAVVYAISFVLLQALSRYREFAADRGSAIITGRPSALISALMKISGGMERIPQQDLRAAKRRDGGLLHLPARRPSRRWPTLFATHPHAGSADRGVAALRGAAAVGGH